MTRPLEITRRAMSLGLLAAAAQAAASSPWKILLVVAHPDDEYYFAATVYRLAQELGAVVDHVVITNGEGGYRYSALAEKVYGLPLTDERTARARLPEIRQRETLASGKILGVRHHYFLQQPDRRFTRDLHDALETLWDLPAVRGRIRELLLRESYDFVFTLLPRSSTHGHHQAATLLVTGIVAGLPPAQRPVILAAEPGSVKERTSFSPDPREPLCRTSRPEPAFEFNRTRAFGPDQALRYEIVVHWVISEHKSQGMFQNDWGKHEVERFWISGVGPDDAEARTARLSHDLNQPR